jgi:hypothetical protein
MPADEKDQKFHKEWLRSILTALNALIEAEGYDHRYIGMRDLHFKQKEMLFEFINIVLYQYHTNEDLAIFDEVFEDNEWENHTIRIDNDTKVVCEVKTVVEPI